MGVDELSRKLGMSRAETIAALLELESVGLVILPHDFRTNEKAVVTVLAPFPVKGTQNRRAQ
jgi:DNA-binding transcriptional regulator GbsR (MarR family)